MMRHAAALQGNDVTTKVRRLALRLPGMLLADARAKHDRESASAPPIVRWNKKDGDMRRIGVFRLCRIGTLIAALTVAPAAAQTPVKVAFDWKFEGPAAPFLAAIDRGYFAA